MTIAELRARLKRLGIEMSYLAAQMHGRGDDFEQNRQELLGASNIVFEWVKEMPGGE